MRLIGNDGYGVELGVVDYQFPDAVYPLERRSWLVIKGTGYSPQGTWSFRWQALTPEDAIELGRWLRHTTELAVDSNEHPSAALSFIEPNLSFSAIRTDPNLIDLSIGLDLEFSPPWRYHTRAFDPFVIRSRFTTESVLTAADDWTAEIGPFPP
ncbi:hypothetical protein [Nocardia sp. NPDC050175]|uniref:WapI family immunity protein n=1 Tax=Nocardia sp. NPDC050175 TaxID=3364317 RepID=UPI0037A419D0